MPHCQKCGIPIESQAAHDALGLCDSDGRDAFLTKRLADRVEELDKYKTALRDILRLESGSRGAYQKFEKARKIARDALNI